MWENHIYSYIICVYIQRNRLIDWIINICSHVHTCTCNHINIFKYMHLFAHISLSLLASSGMPSSLWFHGLWSTMLLCPWDLSSKNIRVDCHILLQEIFPTQGSNSCLQYLLHCQADSLPLNHLGSPIHMYIHWYILTQLLSQHIHVCMYVYTHTPDQNTSGSNMILRLKLKRVNTHVVFTHTHHTYK